MNTQQQVSESESAPVPFVSWDVCEIAQVEADRLKEENPDLSDNDAFNSACEDQDLYDSEWEFLIEDLQGKLDEYNPDQKPWAINVVGFGWRNLNLQGVVRTNDAGDWLSKILPETNCTFHIYMDDKNKRLSIHNFHHDSPTGEWYYICLLEEEEGSHE